MLGIRAMQTAVNANQTISSALQDLRARRIDSTVIYIYAIEDDERLVGEVSTRELLFAPPETIIRDVMRTTFTTINMDVSMNDALDVFHKNKLMALPVVDHEGRLMGILNIEQYARESLARAEKQRVRQVFQTLGLDVADAEHMTVMESFSMRMPWLVCNIGGGILCAMIVSHFEHLLQQVVLLALFLPLVLTLSESISMQALSISVGADTSLRSLKSIWQGLQVEALSALLLGATSGVIVALVSLIWNTSFISAFTMFAAISFSMVCAAITGGSISFILRVCKVNASVAAGPIALVVADTAALLIYFTLGLLILGA